MKKLLKPAEVCELLSLSKNKVFQLISSGRLRAVKLGPKTVRIYEGSVSELLEDGEIKC